MATPYDKEIASLKKDLEKTQGEIAASPSSFAPKASPSAQDVGKSTKLQDIKNQLERAESKRLSERWYGPGGSEEAPGGEAVNEGVFSRALNKLSTPLYAVTGAVESLLGKGSSKGVFENINANIKERGTMGDIVRSYGVNNAVAAPLGFALDIAFDPVNWVTAGTSALLPRIAGGAIKGGVTGAKAGAVSGLGKNVVAVGKYIPGFKKSEALSKVAKKSIDAADEYRAVTGIDIQDKLGKGILGITDLNENRTLGSKVEEAILRMPNGQEVLDAFKYSPMEWARIAKIKDAFTKYGQERGIQLSRLSDIEKNNELFSKDNISRILQTASKGDISPQSIFPEATTRTASKLDDVEFKLAEDLRQILAETDDVADNIADIGRASGQADNSFRMLGEADAEKVYKDLLRAFKEHEQMKTGVKFYDDAISKINDFKIKDVEYAKKALDGYAALISGFKTAKIGLSPVAWVNAVIGNPTMAMMTGLTLSKNYINEVLQANKLLRGKQGPEYILDTFFNDANNFTEHFARSPGFFSKTYGTTAGGIAGRYFADEAYKVAGDLGMFANSSKEEVLESLAKANQEIQQQIFTGTKANLQKAIDQGADVSEFGVAKKEALKKGEKTRTTGYDQARELFKKDTVSQYDLPSSISAEMYDSSMVNKAREYVAERAKTGDKGFQLLDVMLNKSMSNYEKIDQSFKLGTSVHMVKNGVNENELKRISRFVPIKREDIINKYSKDGQYYYRINPEKATEIVNEMYLNYAAMPGAVKILRSVPILGSPFASFMYGMTAKTGKTVMHNPAIFNKVNSVLHEVEGEKSPLEKKALESKYYSWFNEPGMVKVPLFKENPIYMNVANMLPYYTMNAFTPSDRKYTDTLPSQLTSILDKTPILKDPIGQVIFDYFIQPLLIKGDEVPQGAFGQPLYPRDASAAEKAFYAARSLGEMATPGVAGLAGLVTPEAVADYMPSYRWRQLAYAKAGKNQLGISTKESPLSRTTRGVLSTFGVPLQPMDLTYLSNEVKKNIKK